VQGILLIDKPKGWTSFDVVNYVRKIVAQAEGKKPKNTKVGHTGTLDPQATGLLVLLVGKTYTRRAQELMKLDKTYEVTMRLGQTSTTGDTEGEITAVSDDKPTGGAIAAVLMTFTGNIMQTPPIFSAMKVNGQRAYKLAREGKQVTLEARPVTIYRNELGNYAYPLVTFTSEVGSGTYIRSLVEDLGRSLKTGAYMSDLRRTRVGEFLIENSLPVEGLDQDQVEKHLQLLDAPTIDSI
jgi:tRNA pseudouridine55 synthase